MTTHDRTRLTGLLALENVWDGEGVRGGSVVFPRSAGEVVSVIRELVKVMKAVGEPTRLKILRMLATRPMYVCEIEAVLGMNQPRISQHLRILKEADLVTEEKDAQRTLYSLDVNRLKDALMELDSFLSKDISEIPGFEEERARIARLETDPVVIACKARPSSTETSAEEAQSATRQGCCSNCN